VFAREDGTLLSPEHVSRRFKSLTRDAGLPEIRFHGLRHTSASLALAAGVAMKVVSERLGHSTTGITADLYTHVIPAVAQEAADAIARLILPEGSSAASPTKPGRTA
jgi:integrase